MNSFEDIWKKYESELSAFVLSRVKDQEVQKEIMQEVAIKIFTSLYSQKKHLRGWLYTLTKNTINDYYRKNKLLLLALEEEKEPEEYFLLECLQPMMQKLSREEQDILDLIQIKQFSLKEVAKEKRLSPSAVKSRLFRAKKSLAKHLFSCCDYERNTKGEVIGCLGKCE